MVRPTLYVSFDNFWSGFDPDEFFIPLFESALRRRVRTVRPWQRPDIAVSSVFRPRSRLIRVIKSVSRADRSRGKSIWFTGENIRPPLADFNLSLSFDVDSYDKTNVYLPYSFLAVRWFAEPDRKKVAQSPERARSSTVPRPHDLLSAAYESRKKGTKFACAIVSNQEPTRMRVIEALQKIGPVDVFGSGSEGGPVTDKYAVASDYRFMVAMENDLYPGYVTEKLVDSWTAGCIPIWWGLDEAKLFNPKAILNLTSLGSIEKLVRKVEDLEANSSTYDEMWFQPLVTKPWSLDTVEEEIRNLFD